MFRTRFAKEIAAALVFKALALAALYLALIAPRQAPELSPERVANDFLAGDVSQSSDRHGTLR